MYLCRQEVKKPCWQEVKKDVEPIGKDSGVTIIKSFGQEFSQDDMNANVESLTVKGFDGFVNQRM